MSATVRFTPTSAVGLAIALVAWLAAGDDLRARESPPVRLDVAVAAPVADAVSRIRLQMALAVDAAYRGPLDGTMGPATERAIRRLQALRGAPVTGILTLEERSHLDRRLRGLFEIVEFGLVEDRASGALIPMPMKMSVSSRRADGGRLYGEDAGMLQIFSADMRGDAEDFAELRRTISAAIPEAVSAGIEAGGPDFILRGSLASVHGRRDVWARYAYHKGAIRGISYSYSFGERHAELMRLMTYFAEQLFVPFPVQDPMRAEQVRALLPTGGVR